MSKTLATEKTHLWSYIRKGREKVAWFILKNNNNNNNNNNNKKGRTAFFVPMFCHDSHFSPYILFLPLLVPILKNASRFSPYRYIRNGES